MWIKKAICTIPIVLILATGIPTAVATPCRTEIRITVFEKKDSIVIGISYIHVLNDLQIMG
jgi:hypothetical protein